MADTKRGRQKTQVGPGNKVQSSVEAEGRGGEQEAGQVNSIARSVSQQTQKEEIG